MNNRHWSLRGADLIIQHFHAVTAILFTAGEFRGHHTNYRTAAFAVWGISIVSPNSRRHRRGQG